jgi:signal transduction histidine kinase
MKSFDAIFNCMFLAIFIYQVLYFLLQYAVLNRVELFYYSMFLLSGSFYYFVFIASPLLNINFYPVIKSIFSALEMSFSFIQTFFYILFIVNYVGITQNQSRAYHFFRFYKYYCLVLTFVFLTLGIFKIDSKNLFSILSVFTFPFLLYALYLMKGLYTIYANIVVLGTSFTIIGTLTSLAILNYETFTHRKLPIEFNIPAQIGLLFDLFILGYGLSLKAAESDKKLVKSLLENQKLLETERSRLAKDLHDGLGGLLSGIKLTLSSIPGNVVLSEKNAGIFTKALSQLDNTIAEMRRVAHSMMPEALLRFGLSEAMQDYCDGINESNALRMKFTQIGLHQPLEKPVEVILYRIIQELTNNSIKHAAAKNIFIQLNKHERGLTLTVEDDGKGFDADRITRGAGLQNVQSRVDYLKGNLEINSKPGEGSAFTIEIPA